MFEKCSGCGLKIKQILDIIIYKSTFNLFYIKIYDDSVQSWTALREYQKRKYEEHEEQ